MAISRAQLLKELLPGLNALFGMEYNRYENEYMETYTEHSSERSFEQDQKITGFQSAPVKQEGSPILFDTAQEGYTATYVMQTISMGFALTEEAFEDNLYGSLSARYSTELGRAMRNTKEIKAMVPFNTGFTALASGGYGVGDGVPLFSASHPQIAGPVISNVDLKCSKSEGKRVTARLIFDVNAKVDITLSAGGQVDRKSGGPGNVSLSTTGRGPEICFAKIGDQTFGPIQAS